MCQAESLTRGTAQSKVLAHQGVSTTAGKTERDEEIQRRVVGGQAAVRTMEKDDRLGGGGNWDAPGDTLLTLCLGPALWTCNFLHGSQGTLSLSGRPGLVSIRRTEMKPKTVRPFVPGVRAGCSQSEPCVDLAILGMRENRGFLTWSPLVLFSLG